MVALCNYCSTKTAQILNAILKDTKCITRCKKEIIQMNAMNTIHSLADSMMVEWIKDSRCPVMVNMNCL